MTLRYILEDKHSPIIISKVNTRMIILKHEHPQKLFLKVDQNMIINRNKKNG